MFVIDDIIAAALAASAAEAAAAGTAAAGTAAAGGLGATGLGMSGMGGLGAATPSLMGAGGLGAAGGAAGGLGAPGASLLGTGALSSGLGPTIGANLANPMSVAPAGSEAMSLGMAKAPMDYWKLMQMMNMARSGASAMQGSQDRTISAPAAQRPNAGRIEPVDTRRVSLRDRNRYPYNAGLNLLGRR